MKGPSIPARLRSAGRAAVRSSCLAAVVAVVAAWPSAAGAQLPEITGYYLHAIAAMERSPFSESGVMDFQRIRLMSRPAAGPLTFDVAYEHTLTLRTGALALGMGFEGAEPAAPWLRLQGTLVDERRVTWAHGLDRLSVSTRVGERARLTAGRQTISWATTLYLSPTDPFVPFDPADPFREYRAGVDALRAVVFLGPFSELDAVVRPASGVGDEDTLTALVRTQTLLRRWEASAWAGVLHDEPAASAATTGTVGELGVRAEGGIRREEGTTVVRAALGVDRFFQLLERDLHVIVEYQHDELGAGRAADLLPTALSPPALRGELLTLGRDQLALSASYQLRPLTSAALLTLVNARDGSVLLAPNVVHSLADEASLRIGAFAGIGPGAGEAALRSEYGATPLIGFIAATLFF